LIQSSLFAQKQYGNISVVVTSRFGGFSSGDFSSLNLASHVGDDSSVVAKNHQVLTELLGADSLKVLAATHGADVQVVEKNTKVHPGDGLITRAQNLGLVALAADCVPFALIDTVAQIVAVGHCGWQGLVAELPKSISSEFSEQGGDPTRSIAVLGPAICGKCYEVGADRVELVTKKCPSAVIDEHHLDISAGVITQLRQSGFKIEQISACTAESDTLYSYRRDEITGRHALAVVIHQRENEV